MAKTVVKWQLSGYLRRKFEVSWFQYSKTDGIVLRFSGEGLARACGVTSMRRTMPAFLIQYSFES